MKKNYIVKIAVVTHKPYIMPTDEIYVPLYVGAYKYRSIPKRYERDDIGDNISHFNDSFCELTGLYYLWKNQKADFIGIVHYRRHFTLHKHFFRKTSVINGLQLSPYLGKTMIFTPKKRRYYIETLYSHYAHTHYSYHLDLVKEIIQKKHPEFSESCDLVYNRKWGYMFNMMIMDYVLFQNYCSWLFDILFEIKPILDKQNLSGYQGRIYGRISEIMFNIWLEKMFQSNQIQYSQHMELDLMYIGKVKWVKKIYSFMRAKFKGEKYKESF